LGFRANGPGQYSPAREGRDYRNQERQGPKVRLNVAWSARAGSWLGEGLVC